MNFFNDEAYKVVHESAAYYKQSRMGIISIEGEDRFDFLQRQSTRDMKLLKEGGALINVLTTPNARIIEAFQMLKRANTIELVTLGSDGKKASDFLQSKIFFMDKVKVRDLSSEYAIIDLEGMRVEEILGEIELELPRQIDEWKDGILGRHPITVIKQKGLIHASGYRLIIEIGGLKHVGDVLTRLGIEGIDERTYDVIRVEAGSPMSANELNEDFTPLEIGLTDAISENKGCYTGQEVIARQITYEKITKGIALLQMESLARAGSAVQLQGKRIGKITSAVDSPQSGAVALGVIKLPYNEPGTKVQVVDEGREIEAETRRNGLTGMTWYGKGGENRES